MKKSVYQSTIKASQASYRQAQKSGKSLISPALNELRQEIDMLDRTIWSLLDKRFALLKKVAKIKHDLRMPIFDAEREKDVLLEINGVASDPHVSAFISQLYSQLFTLSRKYQRLYVKTFSASKTSDN